MNILAFALAREILRTPLPQYYVYLILITNHLSTIIQLVTLFGRAGLSSSNEIFRIIESKSVSAKNSTVFNLKGCTVYDTPHYTTL